MLCLRVGLGAVLASTLVVGCQPGDGDPSGGTADDLVAVNGLSMINGLSLTNS